jgi:hypothetical protein
MHRSILFYFAGPSCGLFAATWSVHPSRDVAAGCWA